LRTDEEGVRGACGHPRCAAARPGGPRRSTGARARLQEPSQPRGCAERGPRHPVQEGRGAHSRIEADRRLVALAVPSLTYDKKERIMRLSRFRAAGLIAGTALALASQAAVAQTTLLLNVFMPRTHHFFT